MFVREEVTCYPDAPDMWGVLEEPRSLRAHAVSAKDSGP